MKRSPLLALIAANGFAAVAFGAFGAHLAPEAAKALFSTGAHYQGLHAAAALAALQMPSRWAGRAALLFGLGGLAFGGSLYGLGLGAPRWTGAITPLGGVAFLCGWACLAAAAMGVSGKPEPARDPLP